MNKIKSVFLGIALSIFLTMIFLLLFSQVLANTNFNEEYIDIVVSVIYGFCIMVGACLASRLQKKHGIVNGVAVAATSFMLVYMISSIVLGNFSINYNTIIALIIDIILGVIGGVIGVNIKK